MIGILDDILAHFSDFIRTDRLMESMSVFPSCLYVPNNFLMFW